MWAGVLKKMQQQATILIRLGVDVELIIFCGTNAPEIPCSFIKYYRHEYLNTNKTYNLLNKLKCQILKRKILIEIIKSLDKKSIVYLRYPDPIFYLIDPISHKSCKIVCEHNGIDYLEHKLSGSYIELIFELFLGKRARKCVDGIVCVTNEIKQFELEHVGNNHKPHILIGNGISVSSVRLRAPPNLSGTLNLLFVANVSRWHGIDRLLEGLAIYKGDTKVRFFLVGDGQDLLNLKLLVKKLGIDKNVITTGALEGSALDDLFEKSHLAVGSLGLHRMGMKEGSILKAREYCARGIPFLYECSDPDFPDDFPYIKKIAGDESPIDIEEVIRFAEEVYSDPEHHIKMRAYAEEKLDWSVKMKKLKEFCETLVEG